MNRRVGLPEDARQLRRSDERRPAEGVEQVSVGEGHVSRLPESGRCCGVNSASAPSDCERPDVAPLQPESKKIER